MQMVFINPEILKSGADSSTTIKILFTPELQYCQLMWIYLFKPLKHMMNVFKTLVGLVENEPEAFNNLRISIYPDFWIPNNTAEEVDNTCKLVYASILSQEDGRSELGVQYLDSANRISKENADLLYQKTFVPLKAKYEAEQQFGVDNNTGSSTESLVIEENTDDNPYKTGVDNNAVRKNIIEDD
jgi:hypothetical protein